MHVNYVGTVNCLDPVIKKFTKRKNGKIAVVASLAGYIGFPYSSAYCPTKAALISLITLLLVLLFSFIGSVFAVWSNEEIDWSVLGDISTLGYL